MLPALLFIQTADDGWSPGIGDPTVMGWVTVVAYFAACFACLRAFREAAASRRREPLLARAWGALALVMLFLGINKQLDLQTLVTVIGRQLARSEGWYEHRRTVQLAFIGTMALGGGAGLLGGAWLMRRHVKDFWLAGLGGVFIVTFVLVRAASFHHVDWFLGTGPFGIRMNWILELGGIACVAAGARRFVAGRTNTKPPGGKASSSKRPRQG